MSCIYEKMRGVTDEDTKSIIFLNRLNYCTQMTGYPQTCLKCISLQSHTCVGNLMLPLNCT